MGELNSDVKKLEVCKKNERKHRRENSMAVAESMLKCPERRCAFVA